MSSDCDKNKKKKETVYVCQVCGKKKKSKQQGLQCCGREMTAKNKGTWNA